MLYLTRRERFNAAHRMYHPEWTDDKNLEVFGKCSNPNWHGHNYNLFVTVKGEPHPETSLVVNLKELSRVIREKVVEPLDHRNMNLEVDFMEGKIASTENLAMAIWEVLEKEVQVLGVKLHCIRIEETENNIVEYYGEINHGNY
ncbi:MAG TPA: 6-carboxytetrahydropterin synthase [Bacteroidetes bacterium]|nr:6-carboxytetrahydropterin synthase [Bacteroidota bacterium]